MYRLANRKSQKLPTFTNMVENLPMVFSSLNNQVSLCMTCSLIINKFFVFINISPVSKNSVSVTLTMRANEAT